MHLLSTDHKFTTTRISQPLADWLIDAFLEQTMLQPLPQGFKIQGDIHEICHTNQLFGLKSVVHS